MHGDCHSLLKVGSICCNEMDSCFRRNDREGSGRVCNWLHTQSCGF
jgi:hypothetical protein